MKISEKKKKKKTVQLRTVKNCIICFDPNNKWLKYEANDNDITKILCSLCVKPVERLKCKKKFNGSFITGISSASIKKSNVFKRMKYDSIYLLLILGKKKK